MLLEQWAALNSWVGGAMPLDQWLDMPEWQADVLIEWARKQSEAKA
jgi:hypothetical protein